MKTKPTKRAAEKIDCPISMPTGRKERPTMTKPREKTREELQAEIEDGLGSVGDKALMRFLSDRPPPYTSFQRLE